MGAEPAGGVRSDTDRILAVLEREKSPLLAAEVACWARVDRAQTRRILDWLAADGQVTKRPDRPAAYYTLADQSGWLV